MRLQKALVPGCLWLPCVILVVGCGIPSTGTSKTTTTATTAVVAPAITSILPATLTAGGGAITLTITGTGFTGTTAVRIGGSLEATTFVSSTQVAATVPASQLSTGAQLSVQAEDGALTSANTPISLLVNNPVPVISATSPSTFLIGAAAQSVDLTGTGFSPLTTVLLNGDANAAAYVSSTQMSVALTLADLAKAGTLSVIASNPLPGGGRSVAALLTVTTPIVAPTVSYVIPSAVVAGAPATTLSITGTGFTSTTTIALSGVLEPTTFVNSTQVKAAVSASQLTTAGTFAVVASNGTLNSAADPMVNLTVNNPLPVLSTVSPLSYAAGAPATTAVLSGNGFLPSSTVRVGGVTRPVTYQSATQVSLELTPADLAMGGTLIVEVSNPAPGGGLSQQFALTVNNLVPGSFGLSPVTFQAGAASEATVMVTGSITSRPLLLK